jgi:uncharacterized protein
MEESTLQRVIEQTFDYCKGKPSNTTNIDFIWHGGEPTIAGLPFFEAAVEMQRVHADGAAFHNTLQTNGVLINESWIDFLQRHKFRVSVSIDGPKHLHDKNRTYISKRGSYDAVIAGIGRLKRAGIPVGVAVVISRDTAEHVEEIYDFLATNQLPFNIIPLTRSGEALVNFNDVGLGPEEYAAPWIKMFNKWFSSEDDRYVYSSDFAMKTRAIMTGQPQDCIAQKICSSQHISTDPDGFVYPCATLSADPEWCYGSIVDSDLETLLYGPVAIKAQQRKVDPHCIECKWRHVCHGGCMQRAIKFYGTHNTRDYYCPSLYAIYEHIEETLRGHPAVVTDRFPSLGVKDERPLPPLRKMVVRTTKHQVRHLKIPVLSR